MSRYESTSSPSGSEDSSKGYLKGSVWINTASNTGYICTANTPNGSAVWNKLGVDLGKNNYAATTEPTVNDDSTAGYDVGSHWYNVTAKTLSIMFVKTAGAAVWKRIDFDDSEYMVCKMSADQTTDIIAGDHIKFDAIYSSSNSTTTTTNISLDTTTTYTKTANVASKGRITLAAGKTYEITSGLGCTSGAGKFALYDANGGTAVGNVGRLGDNINSNSVAVVAPGSSTRYELRITAQGPDTYYGDSAYMMIKVLT